MKKFTFILLLALSSSLFAPCFGQFTKIYDFNKPTGAEPFGTLVLAGGKLYGTAYLGGAHDSGSIFSVDTNGANYKDIYDFSGPDGKQPNSPLTLIGGVLYGTANAGAAHDSGCVFSIDTNGSNYRDLFDFKGSNGKNPYNTLLQSGQVLYGIADGGAHNLGCIFKIDTNGANFKDIFDFTVALSNGEYPLGITLVGSKLYGMTLLGGAHSYGLIYGIDTTGANFKDLFDLNTANGIEPYGCLIYANGQLFGATDYGAAFGYGSLFSIDTAGKNPKKLIDFGGTNGAQPEYAGGYLTLSGNVLYGTTYYGGAHDSGCIYKIDTTGIGYKDMYDFSGPDGANPEGSMTLSGSVLYGATALGGINHVGVIFTFDTTILTTSIHSLSAGGSQLSVYPNPNNGQFTISIRNYELGIRNVEVYNVLGEEVYNEQFSTRTIQLSINLNQPSGVYFYRVIGANGNLIDKGKITIQK